MGLIPNLHGWLIEETPCEIIIFRKAIKQAKIDSYCEFSNELFNLKKDAGQDDTVRFVDVCKVKDKLIKELNTR